MRISDWSSDVCSSDLEHTGFGELVHAHVGSSEFHLTLRAKQTSHRAEWLRLKSVDEQGLHATTDEVDAQQAGDRRRVVEGKRVSVRVDLVGGRIINKKQKMKKRHKKNPTYKQE